jgi:hypothetical protein
LRFQLVGVILWIKCLATYIDPLGTWTIGADFRRVGLLPERRSGLELGIGELGQVRHHGLLVQVGIDDVLGGQQLGHVEPLVGKVHGLLGILQGLLGVPVTPVGAKSGRHRVDESADGLTSVFINVFSVAADAPDE